MKGEKKNIKIKKKRKKTLIVKDNYHMSIFLSFNDASRRHAFIAHGFRKGQMVRAGKVHSIRNLQVKKKKEIKRNLINKIKFNIGIFYFFSLQLKEEYNYCIWLLVNDLCSSFFFVLGNHQTTYV